MRYLHTMVRVRDLEKSLSFYCNQLGLELVRRKDYEKAVLLWFIWRRLLIVSVREEKTRARIDLQLGR